MIEGAPTVPDPRPASTRPALLALLAAVTIIVGFGSGFLVATRSGPSGRTDTAAPVVITPSSTTAPSASVVETTTTTEPATTTVPPTTEPPTTATTATTVATTTPPPVTAPPTTPKPLSTQPVVITSPPTTPLAPPKLELTFPRDGLGRLVIPRKGTASFTITNSGGLSSQWLVTGTGFVTANGGTAQGTLLPGGSVIVTVMPPPVELPKGEVTGSITVLGAVNPNIPFVITAA